jgi:hypothetical protein
MATLRLEWTNSSKAQFEELKRRAIEHEQYDHFRQTHNEIVITLKEMTQACEKGELLYKTRMPGGEVRHWVHGFVSVCYVVFRTEQVSWILQYRSVPESWPT